MGKEDIRLIASDIDGTLLPFGTMAVDEELSDVIIRLQEKGILFMLASGRKYTNMLSLFPEIGDRLSYLCGNGSTYLKKGKIIFSHEIGIEYVKRILDLFSQIDGLMPVVSGVYQYYAVVGSDEAIRDKKINSYRELLEDDFVAVSRVEDISESVCKVAAYVPPSVDRAEIEDLKQQFTEVDLVRGGKDWVDVTMKGVNKGRALAEILKEENIDPSQCMVFGDSENDVEMLRLAKYAYAMETAEESAKKASSFCCSSVLSVLKELV